MIGAAVLLLLLVVVAPALLEGPDEPASAPEEISAEQPATRVETIVLDLAPGSAQQVDEPVAEPEPEPIAAAPQVAKVAEPPAPKPAPKPASQPVAASGAAAGSFIVQLGIFSSAENADKFAARIRKRGFTVRQAKVSAASGTLHRVYVGPRKTRKDAEELAAVMGNSGYKGIVTSLEQGS
jgi:cell division septation protein DedD